MATETVQMKVSGLMCSFCTMSVEKALKRHDGVHSVMVNLVHGVVLVEVDTDRIGRDELTRAVEGLGYDVAETEAQQYNTDEALHGVIKRRGIVGMLLAIVAVLVDPLNVFALPAEFAWIAPWSSLVIAAVVLVWVGQPILRKTWLALRNGVINANVLLSTAAWGSFAVGMASLFDPVWPNFLPVAAWLMALHLLFGYFKLDTRKKAAEAVRKLLALQPQQARVLRGDQAVDAPTREICTGEILLVRPGERIPLDGEITDGAASVDESSFTGESVPATRAVGSEVIGGTLNLDGSLRVRVTKTGDDTFLSQIVRLMTQIAERKPPVELLADRLMNYYGPVVFATAALAFAGWMLFIGDWTAATVVLLTVIIMGYPCALGISTPMLAAIAGGKGISIGLLVKASEVFYELSRVDTVVFDKTGTLTYGRPTVTDVVPVTVTREELLTLAGGLEQHSEHPVAQSITFYTQKEGVTPVSANDFQAVPGKGVRATVDGTTIAAGRPAYVAENGAPANAETTATVDRLTAAGKTVVAVASDGEILGLIALQDTPRRGVERVIARLQERGIRTAMVTGDARSVAQAIAQRLGIDTVYAELLPDEKVTAIENLQQQNRHIAMVGDGINDAPALAQANAGIAIGAGTDVAIESAGVILVSDRLDDVLNALTLGKASYRTLTGNVAVAVAFNIGGMTAAAMGLITPLVAIAVMIASIVAILLNTLRVRAIDFERDTGDGASGSLAEIEFRVPTMVCGGCAQAITAVLEPVAGVQEVRTRVADKRVIVRYTPGTIEQEKISGAISRAGHTPVASQS